MLKGKNIYLRQIEETDVNILLMWENDTNHWRYSETEAPFSLLQLQHYVKNASHVRQNQQLRFVICRLDNHTAVGTVDLFKIDFKNKKAGIGILIANQADRNKGYAQEALFLMERFASHKMELEQLYCDIQADNFKSIKLFEKAKYVRNGTKKNWYIIKNNAIDAYFYQKFI
ncbi:GNAT family N-acetyltransferase [Brumimicrobium salinarum]|uniref:GNAT family N-acetyltransferase n=1 Tax=Brumimicrobium salinarum TaxID=2058658 RepID=A0A2I0R520_9FLAO|nr:GNAT family protein [Brumimicrobium salinarum]PKR81639.1 GNAT family N-acetyltransferase [Brumimicrobium salinarum]